MEQRGLSTTAIWALALINLIDGFIANVIWPFVPFMVEDFSVCSPKDLGVYVGIIGGSFFLAQFCSSFAWGVLSDRIGRRPTLLAGVAGDILSALVFGFAPNYYVAIFGR